MAFKNKHELQRALDNVAINALQKTAETLQEKWTNFILYKFYNQYSPSVYERTYALLWSVHISDLFFKISTKGNKFQIKVFMNPENVHYKVDDAIFAWSMASLGYHFSEAIYTEGEFFTEVKNYIKSGDMHKDFANYLKEQGIDFTIG